MPGYGGQPAAGVELEDAGPCLIPGRLHLFHSQVEPGCVFPGLVAGPGEVEGVLLKASGFPVLEAIDRFEGWDPRSLIGSSAVRRRVSLVEPQLDAFVYMFPHRRRAGEIDVSWSEYCALDAPPLKPAFFQRPR